MLFQISLNNYFDNKFKLWEEYKLSPKELEDLPFYEYQMLINSINKKIEKENQKTGEGKWVDLANWGTSGLPDI